MEQKTQERPKTQSPELAGGAGFTFEGGVGGFYLVALLGEAYAPGMEGRTVSRVALQQRNFGEPLDDVIVDFRGAAGEEARLSLQAKSALVITAAPSNNDFRDIMRDSWLTYKKTDFRKNFDCYGAAVGSINQEKARNLRRLCEFARESDTAAHFELRFADGGHASNEQKAIREDLIAVLTDVKGEKPSDEELREFLAHFVLVEFDFMHAGATHTADAMTRLRECLASDEVSKAPALWAKLCQMARDSAGKAGVYDRARLSRECASIGRMRGVSSLRGDLEKITSLTRAWIEDIQNDVGGTHLARKALSALLDKTTLERRFVQIVGLPGSGKSVFLRQRVEEDLGRGNVLFLKSDRLEGKSWSSFATANGLSGAPLATLLGEIAATGSDTLYIDGIDRVEKDHRLIVLDVLRTIIRTPALSNLKVVVTLRDSGIEPLRNWLSEVLSALTIGTVEVEALDKEEAELLAKEKPALRPLLFGPAQVSEIVRRPFFAKVLHQSYASDGGPPFEPKSEIDLIDNWWERGGYSASGQEAINRQRAIIDLASVRARQLSQPIPLARLTAETRTQIEGLVEDGILQHVRKGHTVRFSHDIFFEWSFFHVLVESGSEWPNEIRACGEPPAVARVVELLSQWEYREDKNWTLTLHKLAASKMRSQWTRAWLLGPPGLPSFTTIEDEFENAAFAGEFELLRKALVWFQAERTVPNANILASQLPSDQRVRAADLLAWPSDLSTWRRFIEFLLERADTIPVALYPHIVALFEVWQNVFAAFKNTVSSALLKQCADWLREIDAREDQFERAIQFERDKPFEDQSRWQELEEMGDFRQSLCRLILHSAVSVPELAEEYLQHILAADDVREEKYKEIIAFAPKLATTHPQLLVDLTLKHLQEELPDDRVARERQELEESARIRDAARAKPASERTPLEQRIVRHSGPHFHHSHQFSYHDWDTLCIDRGAQMYWPPSPLREPFHSLFKTAPEQALRLFTTLCNHAVAAWRQLHRHDYQRQATPIPLELQFPWGKQRFWGGDREYFWHRGTWAPDALASGFLALEDWCFSELERGRPVDDVIRQIVQGNESIGILGMAASLILHTDLVSETAFPIVLAQSLWHVDLSRMVQDGSGEQTSLMGFKAGDEAHVAEIKKAGERSSRRKTLLWLVPAYVFSREFGERTKQAALAFKDNLAFQYEEQKGNAKAAEYFLKQANENAEIALREHYKVEKSAQHEGMVEITHVGPSVSKPENVEKAERANRSLQQSGLWSWASKCFDKGQIEDPATVPPALSRAKEFDSATLFSADGEPEDVAMHRGAVAGTAAVVLNFREGRSDEDLRWARDVLLRAFEAPEMRDQFSLPQSIIPWHPAIYVARGLAADLRHGTAGRDTRTQLLALLTNPLEAVSLAALVEISSLWEVDAKLVWAGLQLAFDLCRIGPFSRDTPRGPSDAMHSPERRQAALASATECYESGTGWPALPLPPPAWVKREPPASTVEDEDKGDVEAPDVDFDVDDVEDPKESWGEPSTHWYSQYAAKVLALVPFGKLLSGEARDETLTFVTSVFAWTNEKNSPPWLKKGKRDLESTRIYEWTHQLGSTLGEIAGYLPVAEVKARILEPMFKLEGDTCWALLTPFASSYICRYIYDASKMPDDAIEVVSLCLDRMLQSPTFKRNSYYAGEFRGFDEPRLAEILMFISIERASGAARYVNGDWSEIGTILPLIDRYVRAGGWSVNIMSHFLMLCERAKDAYPAEIFADQVLAIIEDNTQPLKGWNGTFIPARIAALVQYLADRETMPPALGQKLLRVLDLLVDMGDRRSAALQLSETFREIKISD